MHARKQGFRMALLAAGIGLLTACGGGGGGGNAPSGSVISGTAAAGAALIGQVTVKDAVGTTRTVNIGSNGAYRVDVSGLVAPFVFRAQGYVGGREVVLTSAATEADINGNINITPFTDLMLANVAGQVASTYFDGGDFSALTDVELNDAKSTLTQRLMPILTNLGIDSSFDLLRSAFAANHSGFDAVMDVVRVTVDESTNTALIKDIINNAQITDDLADPMDATALPTPAGSLQDAVSDLAAVEARLTMFSNLFATSLPSPANATLQGLLANDGSFLYSGWDHDTFLGIITSEPSFIGFKLQSPTILERVDASSVRVAVSAVGDNGAVERLDLYMKKNDSGVWQIDGNQRWASAGVLALNLRTLSISDDPVFGNSWLTSGTRYQRKLDTSVDYAPADVEYIRISGAGFRTMPGGSGVATDLLLHRNTSGSNFVIVENDGSTDSPTSWLQDCEDANPVSSEPCMDFSAIANDESYTFELLDASQNAIAGKPAYTLTLPRGPATNAEAEANAAAWFGGVSSVTPAAYSALYDGSSIHIGLTLPTASGYGFDGLEYSGDDGSGNYSYVETENLNGDGHSVDLTWSGSAPALAPQILLFAYGEYGRSFATIAQHNAPSP